MELTEFLLARIAEDKQIAGAADALGQISDRITTSSCEEFADHIARHDPARVLAECEAKQRIVEDFAALEPLPSDLAEGIRGAMEYVVRVLALPHARHPDYRDEWRPSGRVA